MKSKNVLTVAFLIEKLFDTNVQDLKTLIESN